MRVIPHADARGINVDEPVDSERHTQFRALLGGVSWASQARPDVIVYISFLQRQSHGPLFRHLKQLNRLVRYMQLNPFVLHFRQLLPPLKMVVISDSAFKAGETDCLATKSVIIGLASTSTSDTEACKADLIPLEWQSKRQTHICRSTYAAELHSAIDSVGTASKLNLLLHEIRVGVTTALDLYRVPACELGLSVVLYIDAKSVYDAVAAEQCKASEAALLLPLAVLRQQLELGIIFCSLNAFCCFIICKCY